MNIFQKIVKQSRFSNKKIFLDQDYTYNDLYNLTKEYLFFFKSKLKTGEIICLVLTYSIDFIAIVLSARINGNVICILNPNQTEFEKNSILSQVSYSMIISEKNFNLKNQRLNNFYYYENKKKVKKKLKKDDAFIVFTSGTSTNPKGAILTNNSIKNNVNGIIDQLNLNSNDKTIIYSPPNYAMGISQVITFLYLKCSFLFDVNSIKFVNNFLNKIKKNKISILNLNIASFKYLKIFKKNFKIPSLRTIMCGGMKMTPIDAMQIFNFFGNKYIANFYGCTENSPRVSHFKFSKNQLKKYRNFDFLPVGKAVKGTKINIKVSKNSKNHGEIILSGNSLMRGYLNMTSNIKKTLIYKTNDIGFFSLDRKLFVTGRLDNIFKSGNEKISPEEIEDKISPFLKDRTFIIAKKKHPILNWKPILIVEGKKTKSDKNLLENLEKNLSNFKLPSEIYYLKFFFRNSYGKIDRKKIFNYITNNVN